MAYIYALVDPRTDRVKYVGKTNCPRQRLYGHTNSKGKTPVTVWCRALKRLGLSPTMEIIEACDDWQDAERFWIEEFRRVGLFLLNFTDGGDGGLGRIVTPEQRAQASASQKGKKKNLTDESRARIREARARQVITPQTKEKISASLKGRPKPPRTPERARKIGDKNRGRKWSDEMRARQSAITKKWANTPEGRNALRRNFTDATRAKLSEAARRQWAEGRGRP